MSVVIVGNKGHKGVWEVWETIGLRIAGELPSTILKTGQASIPHPFPPRDTKQFPTHPKLHTKNEEVPLALEVELTRSAVSYRTSRQQRF